MPTLFAPAYSALAEGLSHPAGGLERTAKELCKIYKGGLNAAEIEVAF